MLLRGTPWSRPRIDRELEGSRPAWTLSRTPVDRRPSSCGPCARFTSLLVLVALSTTTGAADAPPGVSPGIWIATRANVETLEALDPDLTSLFFDESDALVLDGWGGATTAMGWASVAEFEGDLAAGAIPGSVQFVMYDPEAWSHTPLWEQQAPATWMRRFGFLARSAGYRVMMTPHASLVTVPGAVCAKSETERVVAAFLRCRIAEVAGETADVVDLQLQALQKDPAEYRHAFAAAAEQARAGAPTSRCSLTSRRRSRRTRWSCFPRGRRSAAWPTARTWACPVGNGRRSRSVSCAWSRSRPGTPKV